MSDLKRLYNITNFLLEQEIYEDICNNNKGNGDYYKNRKEEIYKFVVQRNKDIENEKNELEIKLKETDIEIEYKHDRLFCYYCGCDISKMHKSRHDKTKSHLNNINLWNELLKN